MPSRRCRPALYRLKGHVYTSDAPWPTLVNFVCGRADLATTRFRAAPAHLNELVLIGPLEDANALFAQLDTCMVDEAAGQEWRHKHEL